MVETPCLENKFEACLRNRPEQKTNTIFRAKNIVGYTLSSRQPTENIAVTISKQFRFVTGKHCQQAKPRKVIVKMEQEMESCDRTN